jgi:hypothetical protein
MNWRARVGGEGKREGLVSAMPVLSMDFHPNRLAFACGGSAGITIYSMK